MTLWLVVLFLSIVIEIITVDLVTIWISVGSIFAIIAYLLNFNLTIQIIVCLVVTVFCVVVTRPIAKKQLRGNIVHTNSDRLIGQHAVVYKKIESNGRGEVKIQGGIWTAVELDEQEIAEGEQVEVLAIDGVKLIVKKLI